MTTFLLLALALTTPSRALNEPGLERAPQLCSEIDPNDGLPDHEGLQDCLSQGGRIELQPGEPGYIITRGLTLRLPGTVLTSAPGGAKAKIIAHPRLFERMLDMEAAGYELSNIVFDGNLPNRLRADDCEGYRGFGSNLMAQGTDFRIDSIESLRAMCGSGMEVQGSRYEIADSVFSFNGRSAEQAPGVAEPWADGLTLLRCTDGHVHHNEFVDNTDIGLVTGGGGRCVIEHNRVEQRSVYAFAGLHVWNFHVGDAGKGDHTDSWLRFNEVRSELDRLAYGIAVGPHTWTPDLIVVDAGSVSENTVSGAVVNLAVDGIEAGRIWENFLSNPQGTKGKDNCRKSANYTAAHFGRAFVHRGYIGREYDHGDCVDVEVPGEENAARFVAQQVPASMRPGEEREVRVSFENTGQAAWTRERLYRLGSQSPRDNQVFRDGRVELEADVAPGESVTFRFTIRAPRQEGSYRFQWRLLQEFTEWFGASSPEVTITVSGTRAASL